MNPPKKYDIVGVGFGPSNIALAVYLSESYGDTTYHFYEKNERISWQEQQQIGGADIQNHPLRDLATPINPRSKFTFINYLYENDRLFQFLNLNYHFPLRIEYQDYVRWVADHFVGNFETSSGVVGISLVEDGKALDVYTDKGDVVRTSNLVLGVGRPPKIPHCFREIIKDHQGVVIHSSKYSDFIKKNNDHIERSRHPTFVIVGAAQSAVEICLDLYKRYPNSEVIIITRSFSPKLKDTSEFTYEWVFPEFVDKYYYANQELKASLYSEIRRSNYNSVDGDVLSELYRNFYLERHVHKTNRLKHLRSTDINKVLYHNNKVHLSLFDKIEKKPIEIQADYTILATGFIDLGSVDEYTYPEVLSGIKENLVYRNGILDVARDYKLNLEGATANIYLHGMCETTHGFGDSGSFSSVTFRSKVIADSIRKNH